MISVTGIYLIHTRLPVSRYSRFGPHRSGAFPSISAFRLLDGFPSGLARASRNSAVAFGRRRSTLGEVGGVSTRALPRVNGASIHRRDWMRTQGSIGQSQ